MRLFERDGHLILEWIEPGISINSAALHEIDIDAVAERAVERILAKRKQDN